MQIIIELLVWHLVIAVFLVGALSLSRRGRAPRPMTFAGGPRR